MNTDLVKRLGFKPTGKNQYLYAMLTPQYYQEMLVESQHV